MDVQRRSVVINAYVTVLSCQHKRGDNEKMIFFLKSFSKKKPKILTDGAEMWFHKKQSTSEWMCVHLKAAFLFNANWLEEKKKKNQRESRPQRIRTRQSSSAFRSKCEMSIKRRVNVPLEADRLRVSREHRSIGLVWIKWLELTLLKKYRTANEAKRSHYSPNEKGFMFEAEKKS